MARIPLYKAAETEMIRRIRSGEWADGLRLPNEFGLADEFGVSQGTMRRALMSLESMGLLARKPGRGTIVSTAQPQTPSAAPVSGFDRLRDATGMPPDLTVFRARAATRGASEAEAALFGTGRLAVLERTLKIDGTRCALDEIAVPETHAPILPEDGAIDLPDLLQALAIGVARIDDHLSAAVTSMGESVALSTDRHCPLLVLTRTAYDGADQPVARQTLRAVAAHLGYGVTLAG